MSQMEAESQAVKDLAELRRKVAGVKEVVAQIDRREHQDNRCHRADHLLAINEPFRWKKGQSGNPNGRPKKAICFWGWVISFLVMTREDAEAIADNDLTMVQEGARAFAICVAKGKWVMLKELIDRELGRPKEGLGTEEEEKPTLVKMPFEGPKGN